MSFFAIIVPDNVSSHVLVIYSSLLLLRLDFKPDPLTVLRITNFTSKLVLEHNISKTIEKFNCKDNNRPTKMTGNEAARAPYLPLLQPVPQSGAAAEPNDVMLTNLKASHCFNTIT